MARTARVSFGNHEPADYTISGAAFFDANHNGARDAGERGLSAITVYLDTNNNGLLDAGEPSTVTSNDLFFTPAVNELGNYSFTHLARGTYHVREIIPAELEATLAASREQVASIGPASQADLNFANIFRDNEIHGVVFSLTLPGGGSISNLVDVFLLFDDTGSFTANSPPCSTTSPPPLPSTSTPWTPSSPTSKNAAGIEGFPP